jgi:hypothetical protein
VVVARRWPSILFLVDSLENLKTVNAFEKHHRLLSALQESACDEA